MINTLRPGNASVGWVNISSDDGLSPVGLQAITWTKAGPWGGGGWVGGGMFILTFKKFN